MKISESERFIRKVKKTDYCWLWTGYLKPNGYGQFRGSKSMLAHRSSYFIFIGDIPENMNVLHMCDNPPCVNPAHLFLGTQKDNMRDMHSKNRNGVTSHHGENHPLSKLTLKIVKRIRDVRKKFGYSYNKIAKDYGVNPSTIRRIIIGEYWK